MVSFLFNLLDSMINLGRTLFFALNSSLYDFLTSSDLQFLNDLFGLISESSSLYAYLSSVSLMEFIFGLGVVIIIITWVVKFFLSAFFN